MATLFEYAVIIEEKRDTAGNLLEPADLLVEPAYLLAKNQNEATILAGGMIPKDVTNDPALNDRLVVIVRPF